MNVVQSSWQPSSLVQPFVRREGLASRRTSLLRRGVGPVLLLIVWTLVAERRWVDPSILPSPLSLGTTVVRLWNEQALAHQIGTSLLRALAGGSLGAIVGLALGLTAGLTRAGEEVLDALMQMLRTIPFLALVPLFIVWFGIDEAPKIALIALATTFPMYLNSYSGVRNVDRKVIEAARTFGLNGTRLVREVILPLALPSILTGLRFSLGVAVLVLIAAEQINASAGLGYLLNNAQIYQQVDVILLCIAIYAILGLGADLFVRLLEERLMPWRIGVSAR